MACNDVVVCGGRERTPVLYAARCSSTGAKPTVIASSRKCGRGLETYGSFIAGAGSYTFDGSTLALKADFRKNPNEMNGDIWRLQAQLQGDRLQLVFVNPPFLPGREYRLVLVRVE